jgi:hypothetical protein
MKARCHIQALALHKAGELAASGLQTARGRILPWGKRGVDKHPHDNRSGQWRKGTAGKRRRRSGNPSWWVSIFAGGAFLAGLLTLEIGPPLVGCNIKGNISYNTGERIYHVPRTGILLADTYKPLEGGAVVLL